MALAGTQAALATLIVNNIAAATGAPVTAQAQAVWQAVALAIVTHLVAPTAGGAVGTVTTTGTAAAQTGKLV